MEGESHSFEEAKVKDALEEVKKEQEVVAAAANGGVDNVRSCEESLHRLTSSFRPASMETSGPNATMPTPDQLTIFYGGKVLVFDAIPADKVREIMLIAAAAVKPADVNKAVTGSPASSTPVLTRSPSLLSTTSALPSPQAQVYPVHQGPSLCKLQTELPIARRHSLQRFFEKRRDRLGSRNPYPTPASKMDEDKKPDIKAEVSPGAGCIARDNITQPNVAANLA